MNFLRDKQIRNFFICVIVFVLLFYIFDIFLCFKQKSSVQEMLLLHDKAIVSSLLRQKVSENIIAKAITDTEIEQSGINLLDKLGINKQTDIRFLPAVYNFSKTTIHSVLLKNTLLFLLMLLTFIIFFTKREQLYQNAIQIVTDYTNSNFLVHLPQLNNGTIYQLFTFINNMAFALKSKHEMEYKTKKFLKNTISDISHQLKTPLSALMMYNEIILDEPENIDMVVTFVKKSAQALERIERLIQLLLKITRLDADGVNFEKTVYPVKTVILESLKELSERAVREKKEIVIIGNEEETIICDLQWTSEAISNVVKNALDHTQSGGRIEINWEHTPIMTRICISDNGTGILPEDFHHIFKRFYRSKNSIDTQGVGLGLALTKAIIKGQGGVVGVQSKLNEGTTFYLSFLTEL